MSDTPVPSPYDKDDELLDSLVRRASRGEVDPQAVERLSRVWRREMGRGTRLRHWAPLAAAAGLAAVAGSLVLAAMLPRDVADRGREEQPRGGQLAGDARDGRNDSVNGPARAENPDERPDDSEPRDRVRPPATELPTAYQRLVAEAALQRRSAHTDRNDLIVRRQLVERLNLLQQIDELTAEQLAAELGIRESDLESELARLCLALRGPRRAKAVELLGRTATRAQSLPTLLQLWNQAAYQEHVAPALVRLADTETLAASYAQATSPHVRSALAAAVVVRLGRDDGRLLVNLITHCGRPEELLAAVRKANGPVVESLFHELDAESRAVRYAAARALGALNESKVTWRLIDRIVSGEGRQEALVALAASREPAAVAFLSRAKENAVLATALQSALVQSSTSHEWYGG